MRFFQSHVLGTCLIALGALGATASTDAFALQDDAEGPRVTSQDVSLRVDPAAHSAQYIARLETQGVGLLTLRLHHGVNVPIIRADDRDTLFVREPDADGRFDRIMINLTGNESSVTLYAEATFDEDFARGERAGVIHNTSVRAYVGGEGVFLSDGSAWHPQWIDEDGVPAIVPTRISIAPIDGWRFVASGDPVIVGPEIDEDAAAAEADQFLQPVARWQHKRGAPGVAVVGNRHAAIGRSHQTAFGPVEVVAHISEANAEAAQQFIDAACEYLDLYVPLLGPFPYERFTIVENFFSSGFAYPGFTLLDARVIAMGERALAPGYLDHEIVHNWWGNGVYADPRDGNWCEALTTYCANYYRRIVDDGEAAGREYRRDILMRVSSDPEGLDNGPVDRFGRDPQINRFVGYDKGAFVFMMLEHGPGMPGFETDRSMLFAALMRFAHDHMGRYASWDDLRKSIETTYGESRESFFRHWVREHHRPMTPRFNDRAAVTAFMQSYTGDEIIDFRPGVDDQGRYVILDPDFLIYRVLPAEQVIPTLAGTFGAGGVRAVCSADRAETAAYLQRHTFSEEGSHLLLIGAAAAAEYADLLARAGNPVLIADDGGFEVDGRRFDGPDLSVLHTSHHPDEPGCFITIFHAAGDSGFSRLRMIDFYRRDSTIVWQGDEVIHRAVHEPPRGMRVKPDGGSDGS